MVAKEKREAIMQREPEAPFQWVLTDVETGEVIDRDKYQNDIKPRWESEFKITKVGV